MSFDLFAYAYEKNKWPSKKQPVIYRETKSFVLSDDLARDISISAESNAMPIPKRVALLTEAMEGDEEVELTQVDAYGTPLRYMLAGDLIRIVNELLATGAYHEELRSETMREVKKMKKLSKNNPILLYFN